MASALGEIETFGLPKDYYATYADAVRNVSDAQVNAAAKQFVDPGRIGQRRVERLEHRGSGLGPQRRRGGVVQVVAQFGLAGGHGAGPGQRDVTTVTQVSDPSACVVSVAGRVSP